MDFLWSTIHHHIQQTASGRLPLGYNTGAVFINLFLIVFIVRIAINSRQRSVQMKRWNKLWYCHRCDLEFVIENAGQQAATNE
ncbi:MAG TPA: hypothetical protein VGS08_01170 [Candidatus Saccharimonadales bacterium]|nr:hypothetical protein [Candidatus Saccharimonadales bacterium]